MFIIELICKYNKFFKLLNTIYVSKVNYANCFNKYKNKIQLCKVTIVYKQFIK